MIASDLHELIKDPVIRGQYLAALRVRGKDVLVRDMTAAMDWLIEMAVKLEAAERERDELRAERRADKAMISYQGDCIINAESAMRESQEELARRDAAAGEPVGFIHPFTPFTFGKSSGVIFKEETRHYYTPVYTTAPPALLPPDKPVNTDLSRTDIMKNIAYNQALNDVKALGAQQQKVVELPEEFYTDHIVIGKPSSAMCSDKVKKALDAANVPYEVKK